MANKIVLTTSIIDETGNIITSKEISQKDIIPPTDISDFGYSLEEQLQVLTVIQQNIIDSQADFLKSTAKNLS